METTTTNGTTGNKSAVKFKTKELNLEHMRAFVMNVENACPVPGAMEKTAAELASAMANVFRDTTAYDDLAECTRCDGASPDRLEECPFCGAAGEVEVIDEAAADVVEASADGEDDDEEEDGGSPELDDSASELAKKEPKMKASAKTKAAPKAKEKAPKEQTLTKVTGKGPPMTATSAIALDTAVEEVFRLKTETFSSYLELAMKLREINKKQLWKLRVDDKGKARYSGWDAFVHVELKMSPAYTYGLIEAAGEFTPDDFAQIGRTKAVLLMKAAPKDRAELKAQIIAGTMSKKELKKRVDKPGPHRKQTQQAKAGQASAAKRAKEKPLTDVITIASIQGKKRIKLYAKPPSLRNIDLAQCKRAKNIKSQPFGVLELQDGVSMFFHVTETPDGWSMVIDTRRAASSDAEE